MKRKIVAGNWKSNTSFTEAKELVDKLYRELSHQLVGCRVVIAPPTPYLSGLKPLMNGRIALAAQNSSAHDAGAFTGEYTATMLSGVGVTYVIAGHSERRQYFGESDQVVAKKVSNILEAGLYVILCVGESLDERDANRQFEVVKAQLQAALFSQVSEEEVANVVIAYEPVWAIGTGRTATPEQVGEMHSFIRSLLFDTYGAVAHDVPLLYGGSVKGSNAAELFAVEEVDGALVGGASLKAEEFLQIVEANNG